MSDLLIDAGNSFLKWAMTSESGELQDIQVIPTESWSSEETWQKARRPERIWISCVASAMTREQLETTLEKYWQVSPNLVSSPAQGLGVTNGYDDPGTLGSDRWAAMVAAYNQAESAVLVVDAGTALTIDAIDEQGQHLGGMILPGLTMSRQALLDNTNIGLDEFKAENGGTEIFGTSTRQAICAGTLFSSASLIEFSLKQLDNRLLATKASTRAKCYLTGGDAGKIKDTLQCTYVYEPNLVLKGLALIATDQDNR